MPGVKSVAADNLQAGATVSIAALHCLPPENNQADTKPKYITA
jgi:hypothetical protein